MATGTNLVSGKWKEGDVQTFVGKYTDAASLAGGTAVEWEGALPDMGGVTILGTTATVTGSVAGNAKVGTTTDDDGLIEAAAMTTVGGLAANGDLLGTKVTDTGVVFETSGTIAANAEVFVTVTYGCGDLT